MRLWLRHARAEKDLSQNKLAQVLKVTPQAIQSWESGKITPHPNHRQALALTLGDVVLHQFHAEEWAQLAVARAQLADAA